MIKYGTLLFFLLSVTLVSAESVILTQDLKDKVKIDEILFKGNNKTREATLLFLLQLSPGDRVDSEDIEKAVQQLKNSELFQSISWNLETAPEKTLLIITLHEKWTTIPILLFKADDSVSQFYAGVVDFNFLGLNAYSRASYKGSKPSDSNLLEDINNEWVLEIDIPSLFTSPYGGGLYIEISEEDRSISKDCSSLDSYVLNLSSVAFSAAKKINPVISLETEVVYAEQSASFHDRSVFEQKKQGISVSSYYNKTEVADFRLTGSDVQIKAGYHQVLSGQGQSYVSLHSEAVSRFLWPVSSLHTAVKVQYDMSTSDDLVNQPDLESYLRGGSGRTYFDQQLAGFSTELSWTPFYSDNLNLELMGVADFAVTARRPFGYQNLSFYYRTGPAIRLSSSRIAGVNFNVNLVFTEKMKPEIYLGMMSFL